MEESEKTEESCRLCDETAEKMLSIFDKNEEGIEILQVIKDCLPIVIYRTDPLSKQICESCSETLNSLSSFKKNCEEISQKQKEKLKEDPDNKYEEFLTCGEEKVKEQKEKLKEDPANKYDPLLTCKEEKPEKPIPFREEGEKPIPFQEEESSELKDRSTSTDDLNIFCNNCKQTILESNTINGELELAIAESMAKNKVKTENPEKSLRRRKVVPFYHELDDSLCSSLTEFTHNTEGSQMYEEENSDLDGSDDSLEELRPRKRRRIIESDEESDNAEKNERSNGIRIRGFEREEKPVMPEEPEEEEMDESTLIDKYMEEEEHRYYPMSLLRLALDVINKTNVPDYEPYDFYRETIVPQCKHCHQQFRNCKVLSIHEQKHIDIEVGEKIDNPIPWPESREDAEVRNKWLNYFDENGYEEDDIVMDVMDSDLLIPIEEKNRDSSGMKLTGDEKITLVGTQPMVNEVYLGDFSKDDRKLLYQSMRIQGVNKKFCPLCRYTFKDNWAIESHYFSLACYYTCRYCGMRFNKQRHKFKEHCEEHETKKDEISEKIFAASKLSNIIPKVIHPPKPRRIVVTQHNPPPEMIAANNQFFSGPNQHPNNFSPYLQGAAQPKRSFMERKTLQPNLQIKEEPQDNMKEFQTSQSKTGNQAYFCRKCYKVFFKLDEFNVHSKNCDFSQFPAARNATGTPPAKNFPAKNGDVSPAGRPVRNCAKEIGPYKDDVYLPDHILKDPKPSSQQQTFVCFICNTPFPTIYSRNSHMRIHKGETQAPPYPPPNRPRFPPPPNHQMGQINYRPPMQQFPPPPMDTVIKQEPMDPSTMEPMVEIHEQAGGVDQNFPDTLGDGAVSITPISKKPAQRPPQINPNVMKIVQNNPQLSIKKSDKLQPMPPMAAGTSQFQQMGGVNLPDPDRSYKCSSCWEAFANKSHLYFHKKNQCEGSRLPCPFCKKRFGTEAEYSSHIYYSHPE
ncbi:uncharacterized protein LOC126881193 isoform X2 [Diabrotica virgifera virgifera]|uniref:Uncharacterized protein n=2 Tax=Diabrotica virgifera virgifera TaxID=50390 RepID=A0ABM5JTI5_DIAVI|nr:uncharacterized protein LOC126881193 isoform X2 [Diabrotica virgifera virgifera]